MNVEKWGMELEFCMDHMTFGKMTHNQSTVTFPDLSHIQIDIMGRDHLNRWTIGGDQSACLNIPYVGYFTGYELRTPMFVQYPYEEMKKLLKRIKANGGRCQRCCGIHIHFSNSNGFQHGSLATLIDALQKRYGKVVKKARRSYCMVGKPGTKYSTIHKCDFGHYEARIFNGTLNHCGVYNYWKSLKDLIETI